MVGALAAFVLIIGFRTVPAVNEFMAVQRIIKIVADEGDNGVSVAEMRRSFDRRSQVDDVSSVAGTDLEIGKDGGKTLIEVAYERKVPVVANVSLLIEFNASTADR
jgi:hypothetical protein